jgi:hypothetical protein
MAFWVFACQALQKRRPICNRFLQSVAGYHSFYALFLASVKLFGVSVGIQRDEGGALF